MPDLGKGNIRISIHALLAESDAQRCRGPLGCFRFLSTLSLRRATKHFTGAKSHDPDFYPRSPCGERLCLSVFDFLNLSFLSTLSLRRATPGENHANSQQEFLSTLSLRRATHQECSGSQQPADFYPRSPCGERHPKGYRWQNQRQISIHALLAESDFD